MKSYQEIYTECQDISGDDTAAFLTKFQRWINDTQRIACAAGGGKFPFLEFTKDITTVADTARYDVHTSIRKILTVVTLDASGNVDETPDPVEDYDFWERLQRLDPASSDITQYFKQEKDDLLIWPAFSTAGRTIRVRGRKRPVDMSKADYTTGTITSITSGAKALVGSGTSWNSRKPLGEQWIKIAGTDGDDRWYPIASIDGDTTITLASPYEGTTIAAATASYTLAEFPIFPGEYHMLCVYRPMALYFQSLQDRAMAQSYWRLYDGGKEAGLLKKNEQAAGLLGQMIDEQSGMLDTGYYPPQGSRGPGFFFPEEDSREQTFTLN